MPARLLQQTDLTTAAPINIMPMLTWLPVIVMAGMYEAMSDELHNWQRMFTGTGWRADG